MSITTREDGTTEGGWYLSELRVNGDGKESEELIVSSTADCPYEVPNWLFEALTPEARAALFPEWNW